MQLISQLRSRVRYKIITPFLLLAVCTAVLGSALAFLLIANTWQERFLNQLAAATRIANDTLLEQERTNLVFLRQIAFAGANPQTGAPAVSAALAEDDSEGLIQALDPFMRVGIVDANIRLDRLLIFDTTGTTVADMERSPAAATGYQLHPSRDLSQLWFVQRVLQEVGEGEDDKAAALVVLPNEDGSSTIHLCTVVPIRQDDSTPIVGGAIMAVRLDTLLHGLRERSQAAIVTIYDNQGEPLASTALQGRIASPDTGFWDEEAPAAQAAQNLRIDRADLDSLKAQRSTENTAGTPIVTTVTVAEREYQVFYTYLIINSTRVGILSTGMPNDYVTRWSLETRPIVLALTIAVMLVVIVIGIMVTRQITDPLENLVSTASAFVAEGPRQDGAGLFLPEAYQQEQDEIGMLSTSFRRLTEYQRRLIQRVLRDSSQRAAILESIPDGIVVCDSLGHIHSLNPTMCRMLALSEDDARPTTFQELPLQHVTEPIFGLHMNDLYTLHDLVLRVSKSPILLNNSTYVGDVYVLQDMTAEVNIDRAKTTFTATISHEMRTPLTVIHGNTQILLKGLLGSLNDQQQHLVETIHQHTANMSRSLANVIMVAEMDSGSLTIEPAPLEVRDKLEQATRWLKQQIIQKGLGFTLDIPDDMPLVYADGVLLVRIIEQIVHNAYSYTSSGSVTVRASAQDKTICIAVSDTGIGIAESLRARVCERFVRGEGDESNNRADRGIGLGLAIARQLIEQQQGSIQIESEPGRGTTVSVTLPQATATSTHLAESATDDRAMPAALSGDPQPQHALATIEHLAACSLPEHAQPPADILTLPTAMMTILNTIGHESEPVSVLQEALDTEGLLPGNAPALSPAEMASRLERIPAQLFQNVLLDMLPVMHQRWHKRQRPVSPFTEWARQHFAAVLSADAMPLDVLVQATGGQRNRSLRRANPYTAGLLDVHTRLPYAVWYDEGLRIRPRERFWEHTDSVLQPDMLLLGHLSARSYSKINRLTDSGIRLIINPPPDAKWRVTHTFAETAHLRDQMIQLGGRYRSIKHPLRLVERIHQSKVYRYLTNAAEPAVLPADYIHALAGQYQRIKPLFCSINHLLQQEHGQNYFPLWSSSRNVIQGHVWAAWILYTALVEMADRLAERMQQPGGSVSVHTVYGGLYRFSLTNDAHTIDPTTYLITWTQERTRLTDARPAVPLAVAAGPQTIS